MITGIVLENFKCFERVEIHPKRITCFVGANGTGKSSVLQAFGLLKQRAWEIENNPENYKESNLKLHGPLVKLETPRDVFHNFQNRSRIGIEGSLAVNREEHAFSYSNVLTYGGIDERNEAINDSNVFHSFLLGLLIVPGIRGLTLPAYKLSDAKVLDIAMEEGLTKQEKQTATNLAYTTSYIARISPLLKRVTGVGLRTNIVPPQSVEVKSETASGPVNIVSEGFGTNSLIMLLLQLTSAEKGATVMIEEPEIHLHPKAQAELAEVITEVALEEDKQVIMTTHSEHITGRLLTLVAEGKLTPDDVAIYSFEKDEEGICTAKDLRITTDGTIEGGINDFFETNLAEMNRFAQAQFARLKQSE